MDVLFVDVEAISFYFLVFLLTGASAAGLLESTPDSACLGITHGGCRTVRVAAGFFFCYLHPRSVPTRCQPELSFMRCLFGYTGVGELLEVIVCLL